MTAAGLTSSTFAGSIIQPPPGATTLAGSMASAAVALRSNSRNAASPSSRKIFGTDRPARCAIRRSRSMKGRLSCFAARRPCVDFPAPGNPIRIRCAGPATAKSLTAVGARRAPDRRRSCAAFRRVNRRRTFPASHRPAPAPASLRRSHPSPAPRSHRCAPPRLARLQK